MRLDQQPFNSCFKGSGLPIPENGSRWISRIRRMIRRAWVRSFSTHQARSSKAATSNSKLVNDVLEGQTCLPAGCLQEAIFHGFALQQICGFSLRFDLPPEFDRDDDRGRFTALARNNLDLCVCHFFKSTSSVSWMPLPAGRTPALSRRLLPDPESGIACRARLRARSPRRRSRSSP